MRNYIFDLDMTLLDSSILSAHRAIGNWDYVMNNLTFVTPFWFPDGAVHTYLGYLKSMGKSIGIVTASPRHYAEALLKHFNIPCDYLVTGSDGFPPKPAPNGILYCMQMLNANKDETIYIGDETKDFVAAYRAGIKSIGCTWGTPAGFTREMFSQGPDIVIRKPNYLLSNFLELGFKGEVYASTGKLFTYEADLIDFQEGFSRFYCLGRFFDPRDTRNTQPFSQEISRFKTDDSNRKIFFDSIASIQLNWRPDLILTVPPKPATNDKLAQDDRFVNLRSELATFYACEDGQANYLLCIERDDDYKNKGRTDRAIISDRKFSVTNRVDGRNILLIDDVVTTGSTLNSIIRKLYENGAKEVRCIGLSLHQFNDTRVCPLCGSKLVVKTNKFKGTKFWGCTAFRGKNDPESCHFSEDIP